MASWFSNLIPDVSRRSAAVAALLLAVIAGSPTSVLAGPDDEIIAHIRERLTNAQPQMKIHRIERAALPGFFAVDVTGGTIYIDEAAEFMIPGTLYRIGERGVLDVDEQRLAGRRRQLMDDLNPEEMIVFAPEGETRAVINVFTDIDCGYCRKLHREVPELNAMGIEVRYMAYPRAGIGSDSYDKAVTAWCSDDPKSALTRLKSGYTLEALSCRTHVADQYRLGQRLGISGTPALVLSDGSLIPGYLPAARLAKRLGIADS